MWPVVATREFSGAGRSVFWSLLSICTMLRSLALDPRTELSLGRHCCAARRCRRAGPGPESHAAARAPDLLARERLHAEGPQFRGCSAVVVQAAAGFGKTSLLAQWRIEHLSRGAVVGWLSSQADDNPERFVQGLALAVRVGSGRQTFGHTILEGAPAPALEGITVWLAEVALSAMDVVLIVEDADRLPDASRETLSYAMHNAPPNLRIVVASRPECNLGVADLAAYGQCAVVGTETLRFTLEETLALARQRLGQRMDADTAARLHEKDRRLAAWSSAHAVGSRAWGRVGRADQRDGSRRGRGP